MADDGISAEDQDFLAQCEEEFKDRFTEKDEEFMKVFNREPSTPPILEKWWKPFHSGRRNDRRNNRYNPYHRGQNNSHQDHGDYRYKDRSHGPHRSRY